MRKAQKKFNLVLLDNEVELLNRLVGHHTCGGDTSMYAIYQKLLTLNKQAGRHYHAGPGKVHPVYNFIEFDKDDDND